MDALSGTGEMTGAGCVTYPTRDLYSFVSTIQDHRFSYAVLLAMTDFLPFINAFFRSQYAKFSALAHNAKGLERRSYAQSVVT